MRRELKEQHKCIADYFLPKIQATHPFVFVDRKVKTYSNQKLPSVEISVCTTSISS